MREELLQAIVTSKSDFRTTDSLAGQLNLSRQEVIGLLDTLWREGAIRHPIGYERNMMGRHEEEWWRDQARGETRGEKRRKWLAIIGFYPISDGTYGGTF